MFKYISIVLITICAGLCELAAQNDLSIQLIMTPNPTPYVSDWRNESNTARLIVTNNNPENVRGRVRTTIARMGERVAATRDAQMDVLTFEPGVTTLDPADIFPLENVQFFGDVDNQVLRSGEVPPGAYEICVDLLEEHVPRPLTQNEICRPFRIVHYQAPLLVLPRNGAQIDPVRERRPIFRWTPVTPAPTSGPAAVRYVVQVFEILPGQRAVQAFRANQPVLNIETQGITSMPWPPDVELPAPGQSYVWNVRALDAEDNSLGEPDGYAEPFTFAVLDVVAPEGMSDSQEFGGEKAGELTSQFADGGSDAKSPLTISGAKSLADSKRERTTIVFTPWYALLKPLDVDPADNATVVALGRDGADADVEFWRLPRDGEQENRVHRLTENSGMRSDSLQLLLACYNSAVRRDTGQSRVGGPMVRIHTPSQAPQTDYLIESIKLLQSGDKQLTTVDDPTGRLGGMLLNLQVETDNSFAPQDSWRLLEGNPPIGRIHDGRYKPSVDNLQLVREASNPDVQNSAKTLWLADVPSPLLLGQWQGWGLGTTLKDMAREASRYLLASLCISAPELNKQQTTDLFTLLRRFESVRIDSSNRRQAVGQFETDFIALVPADAMSDPQLDALAAELDWYTHYISVYLPALADTSEGRGSLGDVFKSRGVRPLKHRCIDPWRRPDVETFDDYDILESGFTVSRTSREAPTLRRRDDEKRVGLLWFDQGEKTANLVKQLDSLNTARGESLALYDPENKDGMVLGTLLQARAFGPDGPVLIVTSHCALDPLPDVDPALMTCKLETIDVELNRRSNSMQVKQLLRMPNGETYELLLTGDASGTFVARLPACSGADCILTFTNAAGE